MAASVILQKRLNLLGFDFELLPAFVRKPGSQIFDYANVTFHKGDVTSGKDLIAPEYADTNLLDLACISQFGKDAVRRCRRHLEHLADICVGNRAVLLEKPSKRLLPVPSSAYFAQWPERVSVKPIYAIVLYLQIIHQDMHTSPGIPHESF